MCAPHPTKQKPQEIIVIHASNDTCYPPCGIFAVLVTLASPAPGVYFILQIGARQCGNK